MARPDGIEPPTTWFEARPSKCGPPSRIAGRLRLDAPHAIESARSKVPSASQRWTHSHEAAAITEGHARVRAPAVAVVDHVCRTPRLHLHAHRPASDASAPHVLHDCQVQEAGPGRDVRHVRHPQLIGADGRELALHQVVRTPAFLRFVALRRHHEAAATTAAAQMGAPHQSRDPALAGNDAILPQVLADPGSALGEVRGRMQRSNAFVQRRVRVSLCTRRTVAPCVVAARRHLQHPAQGSSRPGVLRPSFGGRTLPVGRADSDTRFAIDCAEHLDSRASSVGVFPDRTNSTICSRNACGYGARNCFLWDPWIQAARGPRRVVNSTLAVPAWLGGREREGERPPGVCGGRPAVREVRVAGVGHEVIRGGQPCVSGGRQQGRP
jgi:hypothetical protein